MSQFQSPRREKSMSQLKKAEEREKLKKKQMLLRSNSIDADIQEFIQIRKDLKEENLRIREFYDREHNERMLIEEEHQEGFKKIAHQFHVQRQYVLYHERQDAAKKTREELGHRKMRQLLMDSRADHLKAKEALQKHRVEEQREHIDHYRKMVANKREDHQKMLEEMQREKRLKIDQDRSEYKIRTGHAKSRLMQSRTNTVNEMRQGVVEELHRRIEQRAQDFHGRRAHVLAERRRMLSPSVFLELPPLKDVLHDTAAHKAAATAEKTSGGHCMSIGIECDME